MKLREVITMEWLQNVDWKFVFGDIIIPIGIFVAGFFVGGGVERRKYKAKSKINGNGNTVIQNNTVQK